MMSCKQATSLMSQGQDRQLTRSERLRLRLHLFICSGCANYNKHLGIIREALQRMGGGKSDK
ncbi:MAG: zf-HC2 domain-containing protein [Gammaproteobacteria bacterium]|nr:zf-HC2 domain-containing protein [Gammaproteobacteria bacterium]